MDKLNPLFENSGLIAKKITGKLSPEESDRFYQWLNSSEQNQVFFKKMQVQANFYNRNAQFEEVDTNRAWERFAEAVAIKMKKKKSLIFFKYAAAVLLPLLAGTIMYWLIYGHPDKDHMRASEIVPGTKNAILVLSSGQTIDLGKEKAGAMKEADGTIIEKSNDELQYQKQSRHVPEEVLQDELIVPRGGEYSLVLSDGTRVYLNSMSKIVFPVRFSGENRKVILEGEGYFEVQKDEKHPFIVQVNGMQVQVLGTSFNVKAYPDESSAYATLVEGSVKISLGDKLTRECLLEPDQQAVFDKASAEVTVLNVDAGQYTQWTKGRYVFTDQSLDQIMKTLSRWYDFTFRYSDESLKEMRFEGGLNKYESIEPVLDIITRTGKVKVSVKGKEVSFSKI